MIDLDAAARALADDREAAVRLLQALARDHAGIVAASLDSNADDEHDPEGSTIAFERSQVGAMVEATRHRLVEVDAALDRIDDGTYGRCEVCGGAIPRRTARGQADRPHLRQLLLMRHRAGKARGEPGTLRRPRELARHGANSVKCPTDNATLVMSERSGIEIDYCPECRGVWLDRGELDKILDRAAAEQPAAAPAAPTYERPRQDEPRYDAPRYDAPRRDEPRYDSRSGGYGQQPYRKKKKEHWLSELFD